MDLYTHPGYFPRSASLYGQPGAHYFADCCWECSPSHGSVVSVQLAKCTELTCGLFAAIAGDLDPLCVTRSLRSASLLHYAPTDINRRLEVELVRERAIRQVTVRGKSQPGI